MFLIVLIGSFRVQHGGVLICVLYAATWYAYRTYKNKMGNKWEEELQQGNTPFAIWRGFNYYLIAPFGLLLAIYMPIKLIRAKIITSKCVDDMTHEEFMEFFDKTPADFF